MVRVVFFGTATFGLPLLEALVEREDVRVDAVVTQPDRPGGRGQQPQSPPVADAAREHGLALYQVEDLDREGPKVFEDVPRPDLGLLAAYGELLPASVFEYPREGVMNFHASLLPRWRGASPIRHALLHGDARTGVTVFRVVESLDAGPISHQLAVSIGERETYGELFERLSQLNCEALSLLLTDLDQGKLTVRPQTGEPTYAPQLRSEDARLDWSQGARSVDRHVRAFCPVPGAYTFRDGERLKVFAVRPRPDGGNASKQPGKLLAVDKKRFSVNTGDGAVDVLEVQPAGSRRMAVRDYLAGNPGLEVGERFEDRPRDDAV